MNNSSLCIDVSKSSSMATGFFENNKPYSTTFSFPHTPDGLNSVALFLQELQLVSGSRPDIVLEATGNYYKPMTSCFIRAGYSVFVLNPLQTSAQKRKSIRKVKTDTIDTFRIAQVYYANELHPLRKQQNEILSLRSLCRQWDAFNTLHTETQLKFRSLLILLFPNYDTVFSHMCSPTSLLLLSEFPTPQAVLAADPLALLPIIRLSKHSASWCEEKLQLLISAARESLTYESSQQSDTRISQNYIKVLLTQKQIMADMRDLINETAKLSPDFGLLLSIPGVGKITAATILGEIGDITNFASSKQLVAYAGLDPSVYQSGNFKAKNNKISKRGSHYLRKALFQVVSAGICKRPAGPCNPILHQYYSNMMSAGKPHKVAMVATCNKLLRMIFGILSSRTMFRVV